MPKASLWDRATLAETGTEPHFRSCLDLHKFRRTEEHRKYFGDSVWGGYEEALEAAIQWRDEKERATYRPDGDFQTQE